MPFAFCALHLGHKPYKTQIILHNIHFAANNQIVCEFAHPIVWEYNLSMAKRRPLPTQEQINKALAIDPTYKWPDGDVKKIIEIKLRDREVERQTKFPKKTGPEG